MNNKPQPGRWACSFSEHNRSFRLFFLLSLFSWPFFLFAQPEPPCPTTVALYAVSPENNSTCQQNFSVEIYVSGFTNINSLQFSVNWNPWLASLDSYDFINPGMGLLTIGDAPALLEEGQFSYVWFDIDAMMEFDGVSLPDETLLGTLYFSSNNHGGTAVVNIGNTPAVASFTHSTYCEDVTGITNDVSVGLGSTDTPANLDALFRAGAPPLKPAPESPK